MSKLFNERPADNEPTKTADDAEKSATEDFEALFREAICEQVPSSANASTKANRFPPAQVPGGLRATLEAARVAQATRDEPQCTTKRRGIGRRKRVVKALRAIVVNDPRSRHAKESLAELNQRFDKAIADGDSGKIDAAREAFLKGVEVREDFHLAHLEATADRIERCGRHGAFACGSYWCQNCKNRYGARLLEDTQAQLAGRYGADPEQWRKHLLHVTILDDIVFPDPDIDSDLLATFAASIIRRDHREILGHLRRRQVDRLSALSARLGKRGLTTELVRDWLTVGYRDRTFHDSGNAAADAARLAQFNDVAAAAHARFKPRSKRPDLESDKLISWRDDENVEAYMWQLRKAQPLDREDILAVIHDLQFVDREFRGITKTSYPERLKFKSSLEKVIKRERDKLYRLPKSLYNVSLIGMFELELVDLRHSIGGDHQHSTKAKTVRVLASQERKPTKYQKTEEPISFESQRRRMKTMFRYRLLDEARERVAANKELPDTEFPGLQYAVLLYMHVLIDLNGTPREDVERWLTGKAVGSRRFAGQWPLPHQVMVKSFFADKPVSDSLRHISFYPIKGPLAFNYENTAPKHDQELPEGDPANFNDEALALIAWLQHGIGHESLRVAINWPGANREKRGRKPSRPVTPKMTEDELVQALADLGVSLPSDAAGQTDISFLFEAVGEGVQDAFDSAEESTPPEGDEDAPEVTGDVDPTDGPALDRGNRDEGRGKGNDTAPFADDESGADRTKHKLGNTKR